MLIVSVLVINILIDGIAVSVDVVELRSFCWIGLIVRCIIYNVVIIIWVIVLSVFLVKYIWIFRNVSIVIYWWCLFNVILLCILEFL